VGPGQPGEGGRGERLDQPQRRAGQSHELAGRPQEHAGPPQQQLPERVQVRARGRHADALLHLLDGPKLRPEALDARGLREQA